MMMHSLTLQGPGQNSWKLKTSQFLDGRPLYMFGMLQIASVFHILPISSNFAQHRSSDSTALWTPSLTHQQVVAYMYELSLGNGSIIESSSVSNTELPLPGLEVDFDNIGLRMVVPWSLPDDLHDLSGSTDKLDQIIKAKGFDQPVRIELDSLEPADEPGRTVVVFKSFDASNPQENIPLPVDDQLSYISSLNRSEISVKNGVIYWDDKGLFSQCLDDVMRGGIAKAYLTSLFGGKVEVKLNDGQCPVKETDVLYYFHTSRNPPECGIEKKVNKTHIVLQNSLSISLTREHTISRRELKVVWKCIYPRYYVRNAQVVTDMEWLSSLSFVEFNSSVQLGLTMYLFKDESYAHAYTDAVELRYEDSLFFQVALLDNRSFASDVLLQVESCWATESADPQDAVQAVFLKDGYFFGYSPMCHEALHG
ncbi:hypothetical protein GOODEAATRI_011756 [Goodea atripinnis]|uniref:ZP domain-containing protein n=1 Tax=Goodea atripinnis TaxID=208336 RepID=A0ABV0NTU8_9TELE